ncbi:MAG: oligosaccharide flippase family protein [Bacteroidota bacterium]
MIRKLKNSYWLKSGSISLVTRTSMMFFNYLNFTLLARLLEKNEFGTWVIFLSIVKISESVRTAFVYNPLLRFLNSEDDVHHEKIRTASFKLNFIVSLGFCMLIALSVVTMRFFSSGGRVISDMLLISTIAIVSFTFFSHFNFIQESRFRFVSTLISSLLQNAVLSGYLLIYFYSSYEVSLISATWIFTLGYVISSLCSVTFSGYKSFPKLRLEVKDWMKKLSAFGKYTFGTNLNSMLSKSSKEWFLSAMVGNVAVASFAPALRVVTLFDVPLNALSSVYYPKVITAFEEKGRNAAREMYEKTTALVFIFMCPFVIATFLWADDVIYLLVGPEFSDTAPLLKIIVLTALLAPFQRQFGITLNAVGKVRITFIFMLWNSIGTLILSVIAIAIWDLNGAAYSVLISSVISMIAAQIILNRELGINFFRIIASIYFESKKLLFSIIIKRG